MKTLTLLSVYGPQGPAYLDVLNKVPPVGEERGPSRVRGNINLQSWSETQTETSSCFDADVQLHLQKDVPSVSPGRLLHPGPNHAESFLKPTSCRHKPSSWRLKCDWTSVWSVMKLRASGPAALLTWMDPRSFEPLNRQQWKSNCQKWFNVTTLLFKSQVKHSSRYFSNNVYIIYFMSCIWGLKNCQNGKHIYV